MPIIAINVMYLSSINKIKSAPAHCGISQECPPEPALFLNTISIRISPPNTQREGPLRLFEIYRNLDLLFFQLDNCGFVKTSPGIVIVVYRKRKMRILFLVRRHETTIFPFDFRGK